MGYNYVLNCNSSVLFFRCDFFRSELERTNKFQSTNCSRLNYWLFIGNHRFPYETLRRKTPEC